ncbi:MAG TPA: hypothetical protein VMS95_03330 [Candidatus Krumholzibacteriaceae bacterium]|jgi:hypothetical protein|nr:hypothetical protein [Candidatus Krumholzibacteriaceae bacterium]
MLIAIIVLFALYVTSKQKEKSNQRILPKKTKNNIGIVRNIKQQESNEDKANPERFQCPHHFGFLRTRKDKSIVPEECAGCEKLVGCMFPRE